MLDIFRIRCENDEAHRLSVEFHKAGDDAIVLQGTGQVNDTGKGKFSENCNSKQQSKKLTHQCAGEESEE